MTQPSKQKSEVNPYAEARRMIYSGNSDHHIETSLIERGVRPEQARSAVQQIREEYLNAFRAEAYKQMAIGFVITFVGLAVTWVTYSSAANSPNGGSYVVAWGAILLGGWRFINGLMILFERK